MISSLNVPERVETRNRLVVMDGGLQPVLTTNQSSSQPGKKRCMAWLRIEAGHYESVNPKKYTIRREGTGLFKEGGRPSWRLRRKGSTVGNEVATLKEAK